MVLGHRRGRGGDPYFLYAASNLGSFIALIAYPLIGRADVCGCSSRPRCGPLGYVLLMILSLACAAVVWRRGAHGVTNGREMVQSAELSLGQARPLGRAGLRAVEPPARGHELHLDGRGLGSACCGSCRSRSTC